MVLRKSAAPPTPEIRIPVSPNNRNSLILLFTCNGIKIAYKKAASDAQALHRKSHAKQVPAAESSDPRRLKPGPEPAKSRSCNSAQGIFREASDWPLAKEPPLPISRGGFLLRCNTTSAQPGVTFLQLPRIPATPLFSRLAITFAPPPRLKNSRPHKRRTRAGIIRTK